MDHLQWMGAVRMRVQTADKNIVIIHTTPVHQLTSCETKSCVLVRNKSIIKMFLTSKPLLLAKMRVHNNASSSNKVYLLLSSRFKIYPYICLEQFWTVLACKRCLICADFPLDSEDALLWSMESYFIQNRWFEIKNVLMVDLFLTNTAFLFTTCKVDRRGVVWITCGLLWCFYQLFGLSFCRHPFTAEEQFVSKWCNATFHQIWWRNKLILILHDLKVSTFSANFHVYVNYSFKSQHVSDA